MLGHNFIRILRLEPSKQSLLASTSVPFSAGHLLHLMDEAHRPSFWRHGITESEGANFLQVGRYEILAIIGSGVQWRVARFDDPLIGRLVALKLFPHALARGDCPQRALT